jgi:mono/diheme cytochrome c family protein
VFKYTSTGVAAKPLREDLERMLRRGNPGTAMPSFDVLPDDQIEALIEYVEYLSMRGEKELYLLQHVVDQGEPLPLDMDRVIDEGLRPVAESWAKARQMVVEPPEPPPTDTPELLADSIAQGRELFLSDRAQCSQCHGTEGRGDGSRSPLYDIWNEAKREKKRWWFRLPIQQLRPRDLTEGTFRGGSRPIDLYWRIHTGIKGTPMPPGGPVLGAAGALEPEEIWHVVNFVRSLAEMGADGQRR